MINHSKAPRVLAALKIGPSTCKDISISYGLTVTNTQKHLTRLKLEGLVHIESWTRPPGSPTYAAIWALGFGRDAKKPVVTEAMRKKRWHDNQIAYRARLKAEVMQQASKPKNIAIAPQNPFSALWL